METMGNPSRASGQGGTSYRERRAALIGRTAPGSPDQRVARRARTTSRVTTTSSVRTSASPATPASAPTAPQTTGTSEPGVLPGWARAPSIQPTMAATATRSTTATSSMPMPSSRSTRPAGTVRTSRSSSTSSTSLTPSPLRRSVRRLLVGRVSRLLELESRVFDVEVSRQARLELVQQRRQLPVHEAGVVDDDVRGEHRQVRGHGRGVQVVDVQDVLDLEDVRP